MNLSVATSASARSNDLMPLGSLQASFHRDEPIYAGHATSDARYGSIEEAIGDAALLTRNGSGGVIAILPEDGGYVAHDVVQPVWSGMFGNSQARNTTRTELTPLINADRSDPRFAFKSFKENWDGESYVYDRSGSVALDARAGVAALVGTSLDGFSWALEGGKLRGVTPSDHPAPMPAPAPEPMPTPDPAPGPGPEPMPSPDPTPGPYPDPEPTPDPSPAPSPGPSPTPAPPGGASQSLVVDVTEAVRLAKKSADIITSLPQNDTGSDATKSDRIAAYKTNLASQSRIERQFDSGLASGVVSVLREADASLEDANWQLAKKPSPDGRFNGVDVPGALRDTTHAVDLLQHLLDEQVQHGVAAGDQSASAA
ncbi:MAG: hypothetical protein JWN41_194 [Thermoleophilia bacterium]|nr:hypothetical protein [Thermoleophilia bacterium]